MNADKKTSDQPLRVSRDCWLFADTCNVLVMKRGERAIAVDFGSGRWLKQLPALGIRGLDHVYLTHHHSDQCAGLLSRPRWPFTIHAPVGEAEFLSPDGVRRLRHAPPGGCPASYDFLPRGLPHVAYDMAGFGDQYWGRERVRFLHTPGHGRHACSVILDSEDGRQIVACGDAVHVGGTIWQPYHLEWDHWTGEGALAAWEGLQRLGNIRCDVLGPAHGPVIDRGANAVIRQTARRLMALYAVKGQIYPGERDQYLQPMRVTSCYRQLLPHLYQFGSNGYLVLNDDGQALVMDPFLEDQSALRTLLRDLPGVRITACTASHYHWDHLDGGPWLRKQYGATFWLHPKVAEAFTDRYRHLWMKPTPVKPDRLLPDQGEWRWGGYRFQVAHWPGQTWWHCALMAMIDGRRVLFGGDSFQPPSRWNGTGGFCAANGSRFREGFVVSAKRALAWNPDILATGHATFCRFVPARFRKVIAWALRAEAAVAALCPGGRMDEHYHAIARAGLKKTRR